MSARSPVFLSFSSLLVLHHTPATYAAYSAVNQTFVSADYAIADLGAHTIGRCLFTALLNLTSALLSTHPRFLLVGILSL